MFSKLGGGGKPEEEKTVTAGTSVIEVLPSSGKTMKKVTVNPTPSQSKTVTPSTSQQTVSPDSGKLLSQVIVEAIENVTPEITAQTPMISQILSNLGFTADSASGTNKQKLQTNNTNLAKIEDYLPHGQYVWKKLTAQGGDFVNFVVSDQSTAYPDGGTQDGYWYEKSGGNTPDNGIFINSFNSDGYPTDILIKSDSQVAAQFLTGGAWNKLSNIVVDTVSIGSYFFTVLQNLTGKLKLKNVTAIGEYAFNGIGKNTGASAKVFIPNTCTTIAGSSMTAAPFYNDANNSSKKINIYCEATSKPNGWGKYWNLASGGYGNHNVLWGVSESEFDAL